jgi:siroheme synthase-like protein
MTKRVGLGGYPVNLLLTGRRCVVVGGGRIAARKVEALLAAGAVVHVVATDLGDEVRGALDAGRLTADERAFRADDLDGAWLATTATSDPAVNQAVFDAGEARRVFVNAVDDPERCSFTLMSVFRQSDVTVAVGTGGRSPAMTTWLRDRLGAELGPEYATALDLLSEARERVRSEGRSSEGLDWRRALDSGMVELIRAGRTAEAKELLEACLSSSSD